VPIPVRPVVHYMMGGVHTDAQGATPLAGLYAAGECASVSINGANRLGSNSLTECLVFGARAGRAAAQYASEQPAPTDNPIDLLTRDEVRRIEEVYLRADDGTERIAAIREDMQATMDRGVGVFRTEEGLHTVCDELRVLRERYAQIKLDDRSRVFNTELFAALELGFLLDLAEAIAWAALDRRESRGSHARRDFPERDDERFLAHSMAHYAQGAPPRIDYLPVTITRWQPQARTY